MSKVKGFFLYTAFFAVLLLSACSDFHAPVKDFLDEYANRAAIGSQAISVPTERDIDGIECVASDTAVTITFFLRNPRSYEIQPALTFNNPGLDPLHGLMSQSPDRQSITLTFLQSYLASNDRGTDFSGTISLTEAATGRPFPSWDYSLRCNTPPPRPEGARIMLDSSDEYVLCFNLDLSNPVHQDDIAVVRINNADYYPTTVNAGGPQEITFVDTRLSSTRPVTLNPLPSQPEFVPGDVPVYFSTGIPQFAATQNFTITVEDNMGLSRTASTSTAGEMLAPVTVTDTDGNPPDTGETLNLSPDGGGYYRVILSHENSGATIHYTWNGTQYSVSAASQQNITVTESGTLEVWATRTGYIESDHRTIHLVCQSNAYYVDPENGDDDPTTPGTRTSPFKTIEYAIEQFNDRTDEENTIFLLGGVTTSNGGGSSGIVDIIPTEDITFIIDGREAPGGVATINGSDSVRCLYVNAGSSAVNLTLRNLTIRDGRVSGNGAGINFEAADNGSSLTLNNCTVESNQASTGGGIYFTGSNLSIDNSLIRNNHIETSAVSYGAGIYMQGTGSPATAHIASTDGTTEISGNVGRVTGAAGIGGGIYANNINLTISGGTISENTANSKENGSGGGIAYYGTYLDINGAEIFGNTASTQGSGWGGGVYVETTTISTTTVNLTGVDINTNWASTGSTGYGGGLYAQRTNGGTTNINLTGGFITGNTASNHDGVGGGIFITTNSSAGLVGLYSSSGSSVEISGNKATTSNTAFGYGGGIYVGHGGQVFWSNGTISGNQANGSATSVTHSKGEGIYITGDSGYTTSFEFRGGTIAEGVSTGTGNVVYLHHDTRFLFEGDTFIDSNDPDTAGSIYLDDSGTGTPPLIRPAGLLSAPLVARLVPSDYSRTDPILDLNSAINYYKFTVESDGVYPNETRYCINADGELSRIYPVMANDAAGLANALSSPPINGSTLEIKLNNIMSNNSSFTIPANAHVRIIPNWSFAFNHTSNAQLFRIMNGGHLLFGDPDNPITVDCNAVPRQQHLFDLAGAGSLVLRNITVKNAYVQSSVPAALVSSGTTISGTSTVVLESFNYSDNFTPSNYQSYWSALVLDTGSVYHFVSGGITGFNVYDSGYGGVANIEGNGQLTIHSGTIFFGNTQNDGNSVSGNLNGLHPSGLVLN